MHPLLVCTVIKLGHRITYENCEPVNIFEESIFFEQQEHTTILILLRFLILNQFHDTKPIINTISIHFFLLSYPNS